MPPPISIVMSVYNGDQFLREAIDSILNQTITDFEFIVIDDGSTDSSADIVRSYQDERIYFAQQENSGLAAALNKGIDLAKGEYIARMDADDISFPHRLELQYAYLLDHPDILAIGTAAEWIDVDGSYICTIQKATSYEDIKKHLPDTPFIHPSVMFRRNAFYRAGRYPSQLRHGEDTILFNKMAKLGQVRNLEEALIAYRIHPGALSRKGRKYEAILLDIVKRAIDDHTVTSRDIAILETMTRKVPLNIKQFDYHILLAKKMLWDNPMSKQARCHLRKALNIEFWSVRVWLMMLVSFLPGKVVQKCYRFAKR